MGRLQDVCGHMEWKNRPNGYWTRKRAIDEAKKYPSRSEFLAGASGAYAAASRGGFLEAACAHMEVVGSQYKRAIYAFEFEDKSVYVGLTFNYDVRYREHLTQHKPVGAKLKKVAATFVRFNKWLGLDRAGKAEARTIERYRRRGWTILNRNKAGGVGSRPEKWSYEEVKKLTKRYKTVKGFKASSPSAYIIAHRSGWWPELSRHMARAVDHGKWTLDSVSKEALKYATRKSFAKSSPGAYGRAGKKGWLDVVCRHMERQVRPANYWTIDIVGAEARKCETRKEFQEASGYAYQKAFRQGWLDIVCAHMKRQVRPANHWTYEVVAAEARKFSSRKEFKEASGYAYQKARHQGWLNHVCGHMLSTRKPNGYWTKQRVFAEARRFTSLKTFRENARSAHATAYRLGLIPVLRKRLVVEWH
jgi:predicted GIY-YIG superfamily endonuclease